MKKKIMSNKIVVILSLLVALSVSGYLSFADSYPARFRWIPEKEGAGISEVIGGSALVVPFEFFVEKGISRVKIEITDAHAEMLVLRR